ncbi:MAG TPA: translation elongation factor Ts [Anaerolineae bacterium]|nr:translation elongation factor Ts [Anaerolineae bacterium]HID84120.1 translation elongation factor Ts [Anaerolineales bacterium]HIQ09007.1 translation elongation factor Ts [Anaerolineaceae bacterium]
MSVSMELIKQLRAETGAGIMDCRKALEEANGDLGKAKEILRQKGLAKAAKRAERQASEGVIELYSHGNGRVGVMVELNCETDFVAKAEKFRHLAHELALQIAAMSPKYVSEKDIPAEELEALKQGWREQALAEGKPEQVIERIVEGRLKKFYEEAVLLHQPYIRDDNMTVQDLVNDVVVALGENIVIRRFTRWEVGETSAPESDAQEA